MTETDSLSFEITIVGMHNKRTHFRVEGPAYRITYRSGSWGYTSHPTAMVMTTNFYDDFESEARLEPIPFVKNREQDEWKTVADSAAVWKEICALLDVADAWNLWHSRDLTDGYEKAWSLRVCSQDRRLECQGYGSGPPGWDPLVKYLVDPEVRSAGEQLGRSRQECTGLQPGTDPAQLLSLLLPWEGAAVVPWDLAGRLRPDCLPQFYEACLGAERRRKKGEIYCKMLGPVLLGMLDQWPDTLEAPLPPAELFPEASMGSKLSYALVRLLLRIPQGEEILWAAFAKGEDCRWLGLLVAIDDAWRQRVLTWSANQSEITWPQFECLRDWLLRDKKLSQQMLKLNSTPLHIHCYRPEVTPAAKAMEELFKHLDGPLGDEAARRLLDWLDQPDFPKSATEWRQSLWEFAQASEDLGKEVLVQYMQSLARPQLPARQAERSLHAMDEIVAKMKGLWDCPSAMQILWTPVVSAIPGPSSATAVARLRRQAQETKGATGPAERQSHLQTLLGAVEQALIDDGVRPHLRQCLERAQRQVSDGGLQGTADIMGREFYDFYRWLDLLSLNCPDQEPA